jgi:uncharacterized RDD family membrane protein YckC
LNLAARTVWVRLLARAGGVATRTRATIIVDIANTGATSALFRRVLPAKVHVVRDWVRNRLKKGNQMSQPPPLPPVNPYAAPAARVSDISDSTAEITLADRGTRLGAVILDGLIFGIPIGIFVGISIAVAANRSATSMSMVAIGVFAISLIAIVGLIVLDFVWLYQYGQTIAKRWLGIKIVRTDGSRCGLARIIFLRILPLGIAGAILNLIPGLGYLVRIVDALFIFRDDYRCVHDHIADTIVVKA